jgi:hypothetical protein
MLQARQSETVTKYQLLNLPRLADSLQKYVFNLPDYHPVTPSNHQ